MEKNGINILLIEDNPGDARLVSEMLKECSTLHFELAYAGRFNEALKTLKEEKFDVVLLDLNLPDSQGLGGVERITAQEPDVPVIIFTSLDDETLGIQAVRKHAGDYLVKGQINSNILVRSIRYAIERKQAEKTLRESETRVRALNEQILNMLMVVSHDLRSPLVSIEATLKLLMRGVYGPMETSVKNTVIDLHGRIQRLHGIAEDCLGKVSGVSCEVDFTMKMLDLREDIIDPVLQEISGEMEKQNIVIDNRLGSIPGRRIPIKADEVWLKIVFRNLFSNAIKYGGKGCEIAFGFEDCGFYYKLNVYNSGAPVPEESREKLFTKFHRTGEETSLTSKGMGLGLYLTKEIIQQHGGEIWYEPKGWGSNFVLTLPRD